MLNTLTPVSTTISIRQQPSLQVGIDVRDADLYPLSVLNGILNSFGGRLFDEVRSQQGLAYSVSGAWVATPVDHPGLFVAGGETAAAGQFIEAVQVGLWMGMSNRGWSWLLVLECMELVV